MQIVIHPSVAFNWLHLVQVLAAFAALAVSAVALFVAYQQKQTAAIKLRLDLFETRRPIVRALEALLATARRGPVSNSVEPFITFNIATADAVFLFDKDIAAYLIDCRARASDHMNRREELEDVRSGPEASKRIDAIRALQAKIKEDRQWFAAQEGEIKQRFAPYLTLEGWDQPVSRLGRPNKGRRRPADRS